MDECRVDCLSNLPECLIFQILLNIPTKVVVKTSLLSCRWRNLWRYVPALDLKLSNIQEHNTFVSFVDRFLGFNSESCLKKFKLDYDINDNKFLVPHVTPWINTVVERKVQHLHVLNSFWLNKVLEMPPILYTCESLVSLELSDLRLPSPKFVRLPSLKFMDLSLVKVADDLTLETLISQCPILESLSIHRSFFEKTKVLRESTTDLDTLMYDQKSFIYRKRRNIRTRLRCVLPSLKYVEIERPLKGEAMEMKLVSYLLKKSTILKKLTLCLDDSIKKEESTIPKEILSMPRLISSSCQVVIL